MSGEVLRIAMWSGPRNISTAMMRAFENRPDTAVVDEPFYAVYLKATGAAHPMRDEVLAAQPTDWHEVVAALTGPVPGGRRVFYQKHMTHHMLPAIGRDWTAEVRNAFLIRAPEDVLLSYAEVRGAATLDEHSSSASSPTSTPTPTEPTSTSSRRCSRRSRTRTTRRSE